MTKVGRIIAGPCQHETLAQSAEIAKECQRVCDKYDVSYFFKASFDKANRTSDSGVRGVGLDSTMWAFNRIKELYEVPIVTDVHSVSDVGKIMLGFSNCVDVLQVPAFLCRQTDLIKAACATGKIVNIKKGQFLAPWDVHGILTKTATAKQVWITERGTSFGYNNLVVDYKGIQLMLDEYDCPIVFDATHSVQKPGALGGSSSGDRDFVEGLACAAAAVGVENFSFEVHADPDNAPSDGASMLRLEDFEKVVHNICKINRTYWYECA